ncbi:colicin immunity domain-containing protein [Caldibacillus debilis]|uniref:colicin immunity domain-containing protein n=1 Tax=Caldibacillus debilis TaxID=301148 RepID=UPI000361CE1A|nr:colicin immunity domain-containing protein [Caldibacillus debilis]
MTNEAQYLVRVCNDFLNEKIDTVQFVERYQTYFENFQEQLSRDEFEILDFIYMACEYYQSDASIRETDPHLLDEEQLRQAVVKKVQSLNAIS